MPTRFSVATRRETMIKPSGQAADGSVVVRPVRADDEAQVARFVALLPAHAPFLRLFARAHDPATVAHETARPMTVDRAAVVAEVSGEIAALGAFRRLYGPRAEVALAAVHGHGRNGVAALVLAELAKLAEVVGIMSFVNADPAEAPDGSAVEVAVDDAAQALGQPSRIDA